MKLSDYELFNELMLLVSKYDWATEGFPAPEGNRLERTDAVALRTELLNVTRTLIK